MNQISRRRFLQSTAATVAVGAMAPMILGGEKKSGSGRARVGKGEFTYECEHNWGRLPDHVVWGETHGVCIDEEGLIYIKHRSTKPGPMDAIVVFTPEGKFVRSFGKEFHGGGHGIDVRKEGSEEFLYLSRMSSGGKEGFFAKTNLKGEQVWLKRRPPEPGVYENPQARFSPTNIAFAPDGGFYLADGYGSHYIHQYDKNANWVTTWGGAGAEPGKMRTPHGLWLDERNGPAEIVVADRANARLQYFSASGEHERFVEEVSFPADIDIQKDVMLVPDLHARVSLFDKKNHLIAHLGYDAAWTEKVLERGQGGFQMRLKPDQWVDGRFIHPHDACFDRDGNIYVVEWVATGRVTKLHRVS